MAEDYSQIPLLDLFKLELDTQGKALSEGLIALEHQPEAADRLEACMRAAHSIKGAARIVGVQAGVDIAHAMEDCFVAAQSGRRQLGVAEIDTLLDGVDLLLRTAGDAAPRSDEIAAFLAALNGIARPDATPASPAIHASVPASLEASQELPEPVVLPDPQPETERDDSGRVLRVSATTLDRMLGLSGEALTTAQGLQPVSQTLLRLKHQQTELRLSLEALQEALQPLSIDERAQLALDASSRLIDNCQSQLTEQLAVLERLERRSANLARQLYDEAHSCRMRPFSDGTTAYPRLVRDVARGLGKSARLQVLGNATQIDRDILEQLDAPLGHLLRNAVDHGIETPSERVAAGKPPEGVCRLEARHQGGRLRLTVSDDGRGIDLDAVRARVVERHLASPDTAAQLSERELLDFLLLPGFSLRNTVTDLSGRGVGLDVVHELVRRVHGSVRIHSSPGRGTRFELQLPITLSTVRSLLVEIGGEPYAFPLAQVDRTLELDDAQIERLEGKHHFLLDGQVIGLVEASQVLGLPSRAAAKDRLSVLLIGPPEQRVGLIVERFVGERLLVVQPLDARLGKIRDISAGALLDDGSPVLIVDIDDLLRSVEKLIHVGALTTPQAAPHRDNAAPRQRVLVVDDSLTVRELERKLLQSRGYEVVVAVDGMDGWNALRAERFDLVVTDIDMPRLDGIELVERIRQNPTLAELPVMIVSYKDREEDRIRGLNAGADHYLAKGNFHDETLLQAVRDLIGEAGA
ncbi:hybrid sensor histidine kinase/response regulator [Crenobacter sp. SG2303]|uniref:histidine kinase n=1 Tax=Crenobacter oryzisoli TaxID=3056844 RepID=A0ABT7XTW6_9NEIS|nr:hybrid sensor histidine kinase/response regulator [Crenobacter sp. SG2303]MDN0076989.1 hybrid sensor histidine kinase/response regulator [Crenobacter sp. SG2303]